MSFLNTNTFQDRQAAAAKARKDMAEKFLARPKYDPNDPAIQEREAQRRAILEAREIRDIERAKRKVEAEAAEAARKADEEIARLEEIRLGEVSRAQTEAASREETDRLEFEKKLERDARYAARKERKKKKLSVAERWGR